MAPYTGKSLKRFEDGPLLRGQGSFVDDIKLPGMLHAAVLRSVDAHARIVSLDVSGARSMPGVVAVLTAEDIAGVVKDIPPPDREGVKHIAALDHPVLAREKVCYVGQPVAVVVAHDRYIARDALDLIRLDCQPLPPILDPFEAANEKSMPIHETLGTNVTMRFHEETGDVQAAFDQADLIIRERYDVPRLSAMPMETRGLVAHYHPEEQVLTLWTSTQKPYRVKSSLKRLLTRPPRDIRVIAQDVGGGFGQKGEAWPEEIAISYLSIALGRTIKWIEDRMENLVCYHGRGYAADVEAAVKRDGTILGMRFHIVADLGAYNMASTSMKHVGIARRVNGPYAIPAMELESLGVLTNKPPAGPYRGAGAPEGAVFLERTVDLIARELGMDPVEVRRHNFIPAEAFPYTTATGLTYDSGDFVLAFERALELGQYYSWRRTQQESGSSGPLIGVGVATVVKSSSNVGETGESNALIKVERTGKVKIYTEVSPHGQGTETSFAQIAADELGVRPEDVQVLHGDTNMLPSGQGTAGSRGLSVGGSAVYLGLQKARKKVSQIAAHLLNCSTEDVMLLDGKAFNRRDPEQAVALSEVAAAAQRPDLLPAGIEAGLEFRADFALQATPYAFAAHVVVVQIDRYTGEVKFLKYAAVHDSGRVVNPMIFEGQIHGGITQGVGEALSEVMLYGPEGQPLTGSLMDYSVLIAEDVPEIVIGNLETPSPTTPLGFKGIGEMPAVASPAAVANAIADALSTTHLGRIDIPLTSEKIWCALWKKHDVSP